MAATVGDNEQYLCPFPRWAYPSDSPCAHSDGWHVGENDPAIAEADRERLRQVANADGLPWIVWIGIGVLVLYFGLRGMEAYATIKSAGQHN